MIQTKTFLTVQCACKSVLCRQVLKREKCWKERHAEMVTYSVRRSRRLPLAYRQSKIAYRGGAPDTVQGMTEQH